MSTLHRCTVRKPLQLNQQFKLHILYFILACKGKILISLTQIHTVQI